MYKLLDEFMATSDLVALYTNKEDCTSFSVGYINKLTDDKVIILHVGIHGEFDGYSACYIDDIYKLNNLKKCYSCGKKINRPLTSIRSNACIHSNTVFIYCIHIRITLKHIYRL